MSPEMLQTLAPFVPTGFAAIMLLLSIRKMSEEVYVPKIAPLITIAVTALAVFAYIALTRTPINWTLAGALAAGGFVLGGLEGQMTRLAYRGPIIVGKRSVGYLVFWGLAYVLTMLLTATGDSALHAVGVMTLMFGLGITVGDNTVLLWRQLFLKRPPAPASLPAPRPSTPLAGDPTGERFRNVENEYLRLRGQLAAGRITRAQLEATLKEMMLQDTAGRWWTLGVNSGKWFVQQNGTWVESPLPGGAVSTKPGIVAPPPPAATPPASNGCSSCGCIVMGTLVLILLAALAVTAGYIALVAWR